MKKFWDNMVIQYRAQPLESLGWALVGVGVGVLLVVGLRVL